MGKTDFYRRFHDDGICETICTRCFVTVGRTNQHADLALLEASHVCAKQRNGATQFPSPEMRAALAKFSHFRVDQFSRFLGSLNASTILLLLSIALCSYLLPTVIEREAWASRTSTWGLILFFGDLVGCSLLSLGLRLKKTGVFVYGLLKGGELYLSTLRLVSRHTLIWLMDLAPTFIVVSVILFTLYRSQGAAAETGEARPG